MQDSPFFEFYGAQWNWLQPLKSLTISIHVLRSVTINLPKFAYIGQLDAYDMQDHISGPIRICFISSCIASNAMNSSVDESCKVVDSVETMTCRQRPTGEDSTAVMLSNHYNEVVLVKYCVTLSCVGFFQRLNSSPLTLMGQPCSLQEKPSGANRRWNSMV